MSLSIKPITERGVWDAFLAGARPHTFLQSWEWGNFNEQNGNRIFRLGVFDGDAPIALALVIRVSARRGSFLLVPHGPIGDITPVLPVLTDHLKELGNRERCRFIRICPLSVDSTENQEIFSELHYRNAPIHMHPELAWLLDLGPDEEMLLRGMRKTTRHAIRNASDSGVTVKTGTLDDFWPLYAKTAVSQQFVPFTRNYLAAELETCSAQIFLGMHEGHPISGAFIVFSGEGAFYHHGASVAGQKIPAAHLLQWEIIRAARRRGMKFYNFWGIAPESAAHHPWAGLTLFKKGFGGFAEKYLHAQDLPLSKWYTLNYAIETLRRRRRGL